MPKKHKRQGSEVEAVQLKQQKNEEEEKVSAAAAEVPQKPLKAKKGNKPRAEEDGVADAAAAVAKEPTEAKVTAQVEPQRQKSALKGKKAKKAKDETSETVGTTVTTEEQTAPVTTLTVTTQEKESAKAQQAGKAGNGKDGQHQAAGDAAVVKKRRTSRKKAKVTARENPESSERKERKVNSDAVKKFLQFDAIELMVNVLKEKIPAITGGRWRFGLKSFRISVAEDQVKATMGTYEINGKHVNVVPAKDPEPRYPLVVLGNLSFLFTRKLRSLMPQEYFLFKEKMFYNGCTVRAPLETVAELQDKPVTKEGITFTLTDRIESQRSKYENREPPVRGSGRGRGFWRAGKWCWGRAS
eukprot:NODE_2062_length_1309_cov_24.298413_g1828_i1.p1 GENE.NODE_2062_length_1309_cov_24.298413_g1828_i1~~NODE_2062_length_1309_cov_24.298413_g1828_i1.p1  ORF type:complete len:356 (-),score=91.99 NODE_2062_length_1309_cov_24.298413_g1828_i1:119-1186(-)